MQNHQIHPITWSGRLWCFFVPEFTKTMAIKQEMAWWNIRNKIETNNRLRWPLHIFKQLFAVLLCLFLVSSNISNDRSSSTSTSSVYSTWTTEFLPSSRLLSLAVDTSSLRTSRYFQSCIRGAKCANEGIPKRNDSTHTEIPAPDARTTK